MNTKEVCLSGNCTSNETHQRFRVYQLILPTGKVIPFAFKGIDALYKADYKRPPAADYQLVYDGDMCCSGELEEQDVLERIFALCNDHFPACYEGRSLSPSDVVELYDDNSRRYFYCDTRGFVPVSFSPLLAKPIPSRASQSDAVNAG